MQQLRTVLDVDTVDGSVIGTCLEAVHDLSAGKFVPENKLDMIVELPDGEGQFYTTLNQSLKQLAGDPMFSMMDLQLSDSETLEDVFNSIKDGKSAKVGQG